MDAIQLLQNVFPGMETSALNELYALTREKTYPSGTTVCREGAYEDTFYLILAGQVEVLKQFDVAGTPRERLLRHLGSGDFFGEMAIIVDGPRNATVRSISDTTFLELDRASFMKMLATNPVMALAMVRTTIDRLRANDRMQIEEMRKAFEALQRLDHAKLDFIEVAAHELRTPITVIRGYRDVMAMHPLVQNDSDLSRIVSGMSEGTERMFEIINSMLDVSKIDSQTLQVAFVPVLPRMVFTETLHTFENALRERNITIRQHHQKSPTVPFIHGDPVLLSKVFYQLLSNSIKYSPDGSVIDIITREVLDDEIGHAFEIIIADRGIGIAPDQIPFVFEKFYQGGNNVSLHSSSKTAFRGGGPGLGLAISKGIIDAHRGKITIESLGRDEETLPGTTCRVLLPIGTPEKDFDLARSDQSISTD
ncbi:MAG: cyclic nucleotide-binding domain-containing protein [Chloroflexi bacterium]|nr:cyclic nucleotide-binding domain-containing protein [Chloroflexota bacterium]